MNKIHRTLACGLAFILLATLTVMAGPSRSTGIEGQAFLYISYGDPVEVEPGVWIGVGDVQMPVATSFRVLTANKRREVARFTTAADGSFSINLRPGKYLLVPDPLVVPGIPTSTTVTADALQVHVNNKQMTHANVFYFTGLSAALGK